MEKYNRQKDIIEKSIEIKEDCNLIFQIFIGWSDKSGYSYCLWVKSPNWHSSENPLILLAGFPLPLFRSKNVRPDSPCLKCTKSWASAIVAGKAIYTGIVLGKKLYLYVFDSARYCRSFLERSALVHVLAGDIDSFAGMSTMSFTILKSMVSCIFVRLDFNVSH